MSQFVDNNYGKQSIQENEMKINSDSKMNAEMMRELCMTDYQSLFFDFLKSINDAESPRLLYKVTPNLYLITCFNILIN